MAHNHDAPAYHISHAGTDITANVAPRLLRLQLVDNRGLDADELELELDDADGRLAIPSRGDRITVALGWQRTGLVNKGVFAVDETEHLGSPDRIIVRARSADIDTGLLEKRDWSWHDTTVAAIIADIAGAHGLTPMVDPELGARAITHWERTGESAVNVLTRLGLEHDAVATIKSGDSYGYMLFFPIGQGQSITGQPLGHVTLARHDGDNHRFLQADRQGDTWTGVRGIYYDVPSALRREVIAGTDERPFELRHQFTDRDSALYAAEAEWQRRQRQAATLSYSLALGRPELLPEQTFSLVGIKAEISAITWLCRQVIHQVDKQGGYVTGLELESQLGALEAEDNESDGELE